VNTVRQTIYVFTAKNKAIASTTARKKLLPIPELQTAGHVATSSTTAAVQILVLAVRTADVVWSVKDNMRSSSKPDSSSAPSTTLVKALVRPLHPAPNSAAYDHWGTVSLKKTR
jgi:hypothetical protein